MTNAINYNDEYERALIFLERKISVHVKKVSGIFHNGLLLEVSTDFFIIKDRVTGKEEFILFRELENSIAVYKELVE